MKAEDKAVLRQILVFFGVMIGLWVAIALLVYAFLGPSNLDVILGTIVYFAILSFLFRYKGGDLWQRLFPGAPRPRTKTR